MMQRDIVLLPFPFSDLSGAKVRPALVVSNDAYNRSSSDRVMVPLTTVLRPSRYSVIVRPCDLDSGRLIKVSKVCADRLFCVEESLAVMKIGRLAEKPFSTVQASIGRVL